MSYEGGDPGFCGPAYTAPMTLQDVQEAINWYLERDPLEHAKEPIAMLGAPGLHVLAGTQNAPVRGMWVLPGGLQSLVVTGNTVYLVAILQPATQNNIATFSVTSVGTILTSTGPVCIRDNGVLSNGLGGYAIIVDGTNAYYYLLSGITHTVSFTASLSNTLSTITLPGSLPNGLIVADVPTLSDTSSVIPVGTKIVSVDTIGLTISMSQNATGNSPTDTVILSIPPFGRITDAGFLGAQRIAFIEGWLIFNMPGSRTFFTTGPTPYSVLFPGAFFALKDSSTDNLITLFENERELFLIGERTSEVWYNAGLTNFAFARIPGVGPQIGCAAVNSITRLGESLVWLAQNEQGQNVVVKSEQYSWKRISNHGVEHALASYPVVSDAIGYAYEDDGHAFYMLTLPTADVTWCYDLTTEQWHKRLSFNQFDGSFHRHRSNCYMNFADLVIVGDYQLGLIYQMSRKYFDEAGQPLVALRRSPHVWQKANRGRIFFSHMQIEFTPGVGLQTGQGSNPQAMLRFSDDGGFTWSGEIDAPIGAAGQTRNRAMWYLLGEARDRVWEVKVTDPVARDIIGATVFAEAAAA